MSSSLHYRTAGRLTFIICCVKANFKGQDPVFIQSHYLSYPCVFTELRIDFLDIHIVTYSEKGGWVSVDIL